MFRNNRIARILFPLVIVAVLVVTMELLDRSKTVDDTTKKTNVVTYSVNPNQEIKAPDTTKKLKNKCIVKVECKTILKNMKNLKASLKKHVPKDGIILKETEVKIKKNDNAYTVLERALKKKKIPMESTNSLGSIYVQGIDNFYEKDCGDSSGWHYSVNGKMPGVGADQTKVKEGDYIRWSYTCDGKKDDAE